MNIKIKDLTVSDFPGIDEARFNEWKALQLKADREHRIVWYIAIGIWFILTFLIRDPYPSIGLIIFFIAELGAYLIRNKRLLQLRKELKMSDRLWAKKKGRMFAE